MTARVNQVCATCGSSNVLRDAFAEWDLDAQKWVLHSVYDSMTCEDCDGECRIKEVPI